MSLIAAELERQGISTVTLVLLREVAEKVRPPRALFIPYPHGFPLGAANDAPLQRAIIMAALDMLGREGPGPLLEDFKPPVRRD